MSSVRRKASSIKRQGIAPTATPRIRRTRAEARQQILAAAETLLAGGGPEAVNVRAVALLVGVTDAAVNHHFGTRQELLESLLRHAARKLVREIGDAALVAEGERVDLRAISRAMKGVYQERGAARTAMWLRFAGHRPRGAGMLSPLVERTHAVRVENAKAKRLPMPSLTDTRLLVALLNGAHIAQALLGDSLLRAVEAESDAAGQQLFLGRMTQLVEDELLR